MANDLHTVMSELRFVPVYHRGSVNPDAKIELEAARLLVAEGHAGWINRCKAIRLLRERFDFRGLSCTLRADAALTKSLEIQAAVNSYLRRKLS
ncbi:MAG: hypothetical protein C5B55_06770 [Blastocatellia bacterium]|nr:MAG: hypothetical protein C5B55_06770 [Blastocatellia bacterium]